MKEKWYRYKRVGGWHFVKAFPLHCHSITYRISNTSNPHLKMASYTSSILITGGTQGLGFHCAKVIAQQCPTSLIVVASRTDPDNSAAEINKALKQSNVKYMSLDLGSHATVRTFVQNWKAANHPPIQALVLNAAIQLPGDIEYTPDGIEKTFGINHLGHALLFHLLAGELKGDARIVVTASGTHDPAQKSGLHTHYTSAADVARPSAESIKKSYGRGRYATSKLANVLWTYALARHLSALPGKSQTVTAMDPGLMPGTNLARSVALLNWLANNVLTHTLWLLKLLLRTKNVHLPAESGVALARLAVGEDVKGQTGKYFEGLKEIGSSVQSLDVRLQDELWEWTIEEAAQERAEAERFRRGE